MPDEKVTTEKAFQRLVDHRIDEMVQSGEMDQRLQEVRVLSQPAPRLKGRFQKIVTTLFRWDTRKKSHGDTSSQVWRKDADDHVSTYMAQRLAPAWVNLPSDRIATYDLYDDINTFDLVSAVLDAFAENATQRSLEHKKTVWIDTSNRKLHREIEDLFEAIELEDMIVGMAYDLAKYGDDFCRLIYSEQHGVTGVRWMDPRVVERVEDETCLLVGFMPVQMAASSELVDDIDEEKIWQPHDFVHFRVMKEKYHRIGNETSGGEFYGGSNAMYGTSMLRNVRRVSKQLRFLEELLIIFRLSRAIDKHIYYIDVGTDSDPASQQSKINQWRKRLWRSDYQNPMTGEFDAIYDPQGINEDIYWPVRGDQSKSRVEVRQGLGNVGEILDVDYFVSKFYAGLGIPKAFAGFDTGGAAFDPTKSLAAQSARFNRSVELLQKSILNGLYRLVDIHLSLKGMSPSEFQHKYTLNMVRPSELEDLNRLDVFQLRISNAKDAFDLGETLQVDQVKWRIWVMREILGFRQPQIEEFYGKHPEDNLDLPKAGELPTFIMQGSGDSSKAVPFQPPPALPPQRPAAHEGEPDDEDSKDQKERIEGRQLSTLVEEMRRISPSRMEAVETPARPKFVAVDLKRTKAETRNRILKAIKEAKDDAIHEDSGDSDT